MCNDGKQKNNLLDELSMMYSEFERLMGRTEVNMKEFLFILNAYDRSAFDKQKFVSCYKRLRNNELVQDLFKIINDLCLQEYELKKEQKPCREFYLSRDKDGTLRINNRPPVLKLYNDMKWKWRPNSDDINESLDDFCLALKDYIFDWITFDNSPVKMKVELNK